MADKTLVIVESPAKAKKIGGFLGNKFIVKASMGHLRDLPAKAADIPAKYKKESWSTLGVNVEEDFSPLYIVPPDKKKIVKELKEDVKAASTLIVATDEDREGESIGWHLIQLLEPKVPIKRMVFSEITKSAITDAIDNPREIDNNLVQAQETRRVIDRLYGYTLSPLLWKKVARGLSAGRVQSVAVRILTDRELERMRFVKGEYWDINLLLKTDKNEEFESKIWKVGEQSVASGSDFDESTGKLKANSKAKLLNEADAHRIVKECEAGQFKIKSIESKDQYRNPYPPFITSTLQQESSRKLGFTTRKTMMVAQKLYENGHITYMRTDSTNLSKEAVTAIRKAVTQRYDENYLEPTVREFAAKSKNAQEAHEAIRPAGTDMKTAGELGLSGDESKLYTLIWKRAMATQMKKAHLKFNSIIVENGNNLFRSSGKKIEFPGFFRAYVEGSDDPEASLDDQEKWLPELLEGQSVDKKEITPNSHETKPPARYTEASLVKKLESEGIGRPSTYSTIIGTVQDRGYVVKKGSQLVPTFTALAVDKLLNQYFPSLVDLKFTAKLEDNLDEIANGATESLPYLKAFYSGEDGISTLVKEKEESIDARNICTLQIQGIDADIRVGRFGPYLERPAQKEGEDPLRASIPKDTAPADLTPEMVEELFRIKLEGPKNLGVHPEEGLPIFQLNGPFGPYLQLGEVQEDGPKPKRVSIPKTIDPSTISFEKALALLSLPRRLGKHPETDRVVNAGIGRFGPYVTHAGLYKGLGPEDDVLTVELDRAVELLATVKKKIAEPLREIGKHPEEDKPVTIYEGRYGPYIKYGRLNVSLPKDSDYNTITMEQAVEMIAKKAGSKKKTTKKAAKKAKSSDESGESTSTKKTTKKAASKKKTPKKKAAKKAAKKMDGGSDE